MPKKARDYSAELSRRNERARAQGFSSYAQKRRALVRSKATGLPAVPPAPRIISARQARRNERARRSGFRNDYEKRTYGNIPDSRMQRLNEQWSDRRAQSPLATYPDLDTFEHPEYTAKEIAQSYYNAFVGGPERYQKVRLKGSEALRHWFVDILGDPRFDDGDTYDDRYGNIQHSGK